MRRRARYHCRLAGRGLAKEAIVLALNRGRMLDRGGNVSLTDAGRGQEPAGDNFPEADRSLSSKWYCSFAASGVSLSLWLRALWNWQTCQQSPRCPIAHSATGSRWASPMGRAADCSGEIWCAFADGDDADGFAAVMKGRSGPVIKGWASARKAALDEDTLASLEASAPPPQQASDAGRDFLARDRKSSPSQLRGTVRDPAEHVHPRGGVSPSSEQPAG